jgi:regulator of RNase E activity RraB
MPHEESWFSFCRTIKQGAEICILVDIGFVEIETRDFPNALLVEITVTPTSKHAFGDDDDVNALRDKLESQQHTFASKCVHVADVRGNTRFNIWFYVRDGFDPRPALSKIFTGRDIRFSLKPDPEWINYARMQPTQPEAQPYRNSQLLQVLEENGDKLHKPRPVDHCFYLSNEQACNAFAAELAKMGYEETDRQIDPEEENPQVRVMLQVTKTHAVDAKTINRITTELAELAVRSACFYDGWQTPLAK